MYPVVLLCILLYQLEGLCVTSDCVAVYPDVAVHPAVAVYPAVSVHPAVAVYPAVAVHPVTSRFKKRVLLLKIFNISLLRRERALSKANGRCISVESYISKKSI